MERRPSSSDHVTRARVVGAAVFAGLAVLTVFLFFESVNATGTAQIVGYQRTSDASRIVIIVALGRLDDIAEREVEEDARSVRVTVRKHSRAGTAPADLQFFPITVSLRGPLADRTVLAQGGSPVRDLGTYQVPGP
jgi:hypothetical protein